MKAEKIHNSCYKIDVDLWDDNDCIEMGKFLSGNLVGFVDDSVTEERLHYIQTKLWGTPSRPMVQDAALRGEVKGRHWRDIQVQMTLIAKQLEDTHAHRDAMSRISFEVDEKSGRPKGGFPEGQLYWHSDQQSHHDNQRMIGLMSISNTENSQTSFLPTKEFYETLNHEDKSMVDELIAVWEWDGGTMNVGVNKTFNRTVTHYHMAPVDGIESPLIEYTADGTKGMRFPTHCFRKFKGMSREDSLKFREKLWNKLNTDEYVYTHDWKDGQIMFMDQNITIHCRPTQKEMSPKRTLVRTNTYLDKIYDGKGPITDWTVDGVTYKWSEFLKLCDQNKLDEFEGRKSWNDAY